MKEHFKKLDLSDEFMENFTGFMLGDGYLSNRNKSTHSSQFIIVNVNPSYIHSTARLFKSEGIEHTVRIKNRPGGFSGSRISSTLDTKFYVTFAELEDRWYDQRSDGTHYKVVPNDLKLTPISLLQWYIGDGYLVNLKGSPVRVQFCTDRYTDDEIVFLNECFTRDFGLSIQIDWNRRRLRVPKRMLGDFFDILPKCPSLIEDELGYKWA